MSMIQKLLEMCEQDHDICDNLRAVKGAKYAEAVSAFANLIAMTELITKMHPELNTSVRAVTCDAHLVVARLLDADFEAFMNDVIMIAHSRIGGATTVMGFKKAPGDDRG